MGKRRQVVVEATPIADAWARPDDEVLRALGTSSEGLASSEARARLVRFGRNELVTRDALSRTRVLWNQVKSPLLLLLFFAVVISLLVGEWIDATIVLSIVLVSVAIGYRREYAAATVALALRKRLATRADVRRDGATVSIPVEEIVPGDIVLLAAGSLVPADARVLEATDCHVSEAILTGESFPTEKAPGVVAASASIAERTNSVFLGTNVRSGTARCVVVATAGATEFGGIAHRITLDPEETEFDRGVRRFGFLLTRAMLVMVLLVYVAHTMLGRSPIETLLFAIALAVGLSPELLPAILTVNLSRGAVTMAERGVLVRHLDAIENLGSMDVLCTDKTGTLTKGVVELEGAYDALGRPSDAVLAMGILNATFETGLPSPLDDAILAARPEDTSAWKKRAEIPFDFRRKRVSVVVEREGRITLVMKGAFRQVLEICDALADGTTLDDARREAIVALFETWSARGTRVLAVASRTLEDAISYGRDRESGLVFEGFLTFVDKPKEGVPDALRAMASLGVTVKIISGDNALVAAHVARTVGIPCERVLTGPEIESLHDEALWHAAERTRVFAEVDPNQKERILLALKKMGHVVGFLGDGVNDAPAMHAADTGISVDTAVDVAREAADFVLLDRDLDVIRRGIEEGRKTFANTEKYVLTTTSANLGNMTSMAFASLFLPFLPLLPGQILLNNFLSDIPAIGIADDSVDADLVASPRRWDMRFIGRFMVVFGLLSSFFDFVTFAMLVLVFRASAELFRTGWFVESLLTELVIALVVRTRGPFYRSRPGTVLFVSSLVLVPVAFAIPYLPFAGAFGFVPPPPVLSLALAGVVVAYVLFAEITKVYFHRHVDRARARTRP